MIKNKIINPIHVREGDFVDIHWHTPEEIYIERRECPPKATREARKESEKKMEQ